MTRGAALLSAVLLAATLGAAQNPSASANASTPPAVAANPGTPENPNLPKTDSALPLLGLVGLGSLAAGFIMRR